jgi:transcriptional regulator with XRE-family HTH domain
MNPTIEISDPDMLGRELRRRREERGEPLRVVAKRARMTLQQLHCYEAGTSRPGTLVLMRLCKALECDIIFTPWAA